MDKDGINRNIFNGFIAYTLSHNRPIAEVLEPHWKNNADIFNHEFKGMTKDPISIEELNVIPQKMVLALKAHFTQNDYDFLISFKKGSPDWSIAPLQQIQYLPAVKWKLLNIKKMPLNKHNESIKKLESTLAKWL